MAYIDDIFKRYLNNSCTEEELSILLRYFELDEYADDLRMLVEQELLKPEEERTLSEPLAQIVERNRHVIIDSIQTSGNKATKIKKLLIAVSVAAITLLVGTWMFLHVGQQSTKEVEIVEQHDLTPGTNRATLTLEDGQLIVLNEEKIGIVVGEEGIVYTDGTNITEHVAIQYATLSTPRKGQYQAVLPDGTKVWLNAESSLRYPTAFTEKDRVVELTGEAYFEVAHQAKQPFIVMTESQRLKVLGTVFNINAYANEPHIATTLVSGSVELNSPQIHLSQSLKPNQQAVLGQKGYQINAVDITPYIAWKDGEFRFKATPLPEVLRQVERWYDLEVDYSHIPENIKVHASIRRERNLSSVLYALEKTADIKFEVKGRRLQLMK